MAAEAALKADLLQRLSSAEGHLRGIAGMVERGADCESVVRQTLAVQAALRQITHLALRHHLEHCVPQRLTGASGDSAAREQCLSEITALYRMLGGRLPPEGKDGVCLE
jgi:DNA-binding FrmR family transcriptional regulator